MPGYILVVDDEADITSAVAWSLRKEGYDTREAGGGLEALERAGRDPLPDLIILDVMMSDMTGIEVCRRLRSDPITAEIPILMLTARDEEIDRVVGFEVGADDYMVKPFSMRELLLRVTAILRRSRPMADKPAISVGPIRLDLEAHRVWLEDNEVLLTALEFRLLATLVSRPGRVQSREVLLRDVWDIDAPVTTRTVDTHIKRLREKLGEAAALVETVRGVGYRFSDTT